MDIATFRKQVLNFFDQNITDHETHDAFFNNFTIVWKKLLQHGRFIQGEQLWQVAAESARNWERQNQNMLIHKGSAYYFWGVTCILKEDFEKGFLLMHQSLGQDKKNPTIDFHNTPAYSFVMLDAQKQDHFFTSKVLEIGSFVEELLIQYHKMRNIDHLAFLSSLMSLNLTKDRLGKINGCFNNDFPNTLTDLLRSQYTSPDGVNIHGIEEDLVITYGLKNFGAHEIQNQPEISNNLEAIVQRCMNGIFFTITSLY